MVETRSIIDYFTQLQDKICLALEQLDQRGRFQEDIWQRDGGGGGRTRILEGNHIEKGGVNFSHVYGDVTPTMRENMNMNGEQWLASGVSIVLHPVSPRVPIIHMNVRYFELDGGREWWFGGGIDMTPHYINPELASSFHQKLYLVCDRFGKGKYEEYKKWADDYFYLPHRGETRGVGGIFFDHLNQTSGHSKEAIFEFVKEVGEAFIPIYQEQFLQTSNMPYGAAQEEWQMIRRGRYAEFNLVWDRGTKFGLISQGRTESILMSLPPRVAWKYKYETEDPEAIQTLQWLKKRVDWLNLKQ
ncbi:MAG TPA: oxygen-dependent coproporphyrinogen oxidase [Membranihabitans sp.]|nr:oxygen-dependent coproporphyrinogen oxidase [Membranihabitans sp.]